MLTDGVMFMQPDPRHSPVGSVQTIVDWTHKHGVAPISYFPLGAKQGAGGNPATCLRAWQDSLWPTHEGDLGLTRRTGNYRNGIFYVSRLLVRRRPRLFWHRLYQLVNGTEMCAPTMSNQCKPEDHRVHQVIDGNNRTKHRSNSFFVHLLRHLT